MSQFINLPISYIPSVSRGCAWRAIHTPALLCVRTENSKRVILPRGGSRQSYDVTFVVLKTGHSVKIEHVEINDNCDKGTRF